jgi:hypothetical protein
MRRLGSNFDSSNALIVPLNLALRMIV